MQKPITYRKLVDNSGCVHTEVRGVMHGLPHIGRLANEDLRSHSCQCGHEPVQCTPGLWKHENNGISFTLVVDDFGVKFNTIKSLTHLIDALKKQM